MSSAIQEREEATRDLLTVAYILVVVGAGLLFLGIGLILSDDSDRFSDYSIYMEIGILMLILGLAILVLRSVYLSASLPMKGKIRQSASSQHPCPICGRPMSWKGDSGRWFCHYCQKYG